MNLRQLQKKRFHNSVFGFPKGEFGEEVIEGSEPWKVRKTHKYECHLERVAGLVFTDNDDYAGKVAAGVAGGLRNYDGDGEGGEGGCDREVGGVRDGGHYANGDEAPGVGTGGIWNASERDALRRLVLQFGVPGRWDVIHKASTQTDKYLERASDCELKSYTVSFLRQLLQCLEINDGKKHD